MLSNFQTMLYHIRRTVSFLLAVALLVTGIQFPAYAESYSNYLDGWKVSCAWSTLSTDYTWDATTDSSKQPKIVVTYRLENAEHDYAAGDIQFDIPGIRNANRANNLMASDLSSDAEDSDWECEWDQENDIYTFTNTFTVSTGQSVSGGFELLWTLSARDTENGYTQSKSPVFRVKDESGETSSITMTPLTFTFTSVRDRYRIYMDYSKLEASDWDAADQDYIWYEITTRFDNDWLARGLF
ncbi:MAG: DUF2937 family protein, partial [Clostridiales bacterium]|nr:DUF2937 family protein [Clostridiales bacterium]